MGTTYTAPNNPGVEQLSYNSADGCQVTKSATEKVGFYGATPVTQRSSTLQAASVVSVSSNITIAASLTAWIVEVTATLVGLGVWKGS